MLDLDASLVDQPALAAHITAGSGLRIDARDLAPQLRIFAKRRAMATLGARLDERQGEGQGCPVIFYGSGDFHHLSTLFIERARVPVTVIHFDNHPDWVRFPPTHNCGGWVNRALALPHVGRVVTIGPCSDDLSRPEYKTANLRAVANGRLEVHAWRHAPSGVLGEYGDTPGWRQQGRALHWRALASQDWDAFLSSLIARLPATALWITLDKDVLGPAEACTNWDQGAMPLDHVLVALARLAGARDIAGVDICGEWSPPLFTDPLRAILARLDHPANDTPSAQALAVNDATNARLLECFERVLH